MANKTTSPRRLAANRANAQRSTGPKTSKGKAKSSLNAVKTGLTGRTVLLPSEDVKQYQNHVKRFHDELQPVGELETNVVQSLADTQWRLNRIPSLESGILALGRKRCDPDLFAEEKKPPNPRSAAPGARFQHRSAAAQEPVPAGKPPAPPVCATHPGTGAA